MSTGASVVVLLAAVIGIIAILMAVAADAGKHRAQNALHRALQVGQQQHDDIKMLLALLSKNEQPRPDHLFLMHHRARASQEELDLLYLELLNVLPPLPTSPEELIGN